MNFIYNGRQALFVQIDDTITRTNASVTRHSVEHNTLHANGSPLHFTGLPLCFRMMFYLLPMFTECGRGSISVQSPVTYQVKRISVREVVSL